MDPNGWIDPVARTVVSGFAASTALLALGWIVARRNGSRVSTAFLANLGGPLLLVGPLLGIRMALPLVRGLDANVLELLRHGLVLAVIGLVGWMVIGLAAFLDVYISERFPVSVGDNLAARRLLTRFQVLRRIVVALTVLLCGSAALMTFPGMQALGTGLLASAGIIGIVIGIAARPSVEAFIAGIQVAWTQPFRLDDVVIIDGEWGRIEEIQTTYVVVRLWDLRRLVVPLSYLLSHPFQNWTRTSADLIGAVTVDLDYRTPVDAVRRRVGELLAESELFDDGFWNLQVVDAGPQTMRLRVLVAAPNADKAWALRCEIREKLIAWLQTAHPDCLPRVRAEVGNPALEDRSG